MRDDLPIAFFYLAIIYIILRHLVDIIHAPKDPFFSLFNVTGFPFHLSNISKKRD